MGTRSVESRQREQLLGEWRERVQEAVRLGQLMGKAGRTLWLRVSIVGGEQTCSVERAGWRG